MANSRHGNVIRIDTDATFTGPFEIVGIKYIAGTGTPQVIITDNSSIGDNLYENTSATTTYEQISIRGNDGYHVNVAGTSTVVFIYLK